MIATRSMNLHSAWEAVSDNIYKLTDEVMLDISPGSSYGGRVELIVDDEVILSEGSTADYRFRANTVAISYFAYKKYIDSEYEIPKLERPDKPIDRWGKEDMSSLDRFLLWNEGYKTTKWSPWNRYTRLSTAISKFPSLEMPSPSDDIVEYDDYSECYRVKSSVLAEYVNVKNDS